MNEQTARRIVRQRSGGDCEVRISGVCKGRAREFHHRKNRSQGGQWTPSNALDLCSSCHMYITTHPAAAREKGWAVPSHADPACTAVEVWMWGSMQAFAYLDDQGCLHLAEAPDDVA